MPRVPFNSKGERPQIGIYSYGTVVPQDFAGQFEFDVTTLRDPTGQQQFKGLNGLYPAVRDWVGSDRRVSIIIKDILLLADDMAKPKTKEGRAQPEPISPYVSFAFKDYHGKWIAPAVAELVADILDKEGFRVAVHHRGIPLDERPEAKVEPIKEVTNGA